ncbi:MAG: hypothetical protein CMH41_06155 [Micrococcales bacterium]|nr:hypothetical protein [Micrococcales bacterium]
MSDEQEDRGRRGPFSRITNAAAGAIDVNDIVERVDVNELISRVDVDELIQRVDVDAVIDRVDVNEVLDRVDPDRLLDRVDPNRLLDRVDPDRLLDRVDPNRLMDRVDVDRLMDRVDVKGLVDRAGVADIVGDTTGQMAGSLLDAARRQVVAVDEIVGRVAFKIVGRNPDKVPEGPANLASTFSPDEKGRGVVQGHYAGPVSRLLSFFIDVFTVFGLYTVVSAGIVFFVNNILQVQVQTDSLPIWATILSYLVWVFSYVFVSTLLFGRTVGKGILGLMVVDKDGSPVSAKEVLLRVIFFPLSFVFFGIGLLGIVFGSERRAWHDKIAGTAVVYDWGRRSAALPAPLTSWIERKSGESSAPQH